MKKIQIKKGFPIYSVLIILGLILARTPFVNADETSLSNNTHFIESFKQKYGSNWIIKWNEITDTPHSILGSSYDLGVGTISSEEKAEMTATDFLSENSDMFKINNNLKLLSVEQGNNEWYVEYQQYHQDLIVFNGQAFVTLSNNGELISTGSDIYSSVYVDEPFLNKEDAIKLAKDNFSNTPKVEIKKALLIIYPGEDNQYYTVWDIQLFSNSPLEGKEYFIDSVSGNIISENNLIVSGDEEDESNVKNNDSEDRNGQIIFLLGIVIIIALVLLVLYRYNKNKPTRKIKNEI
ncbi:MAG: PepSY domain-containing protein [Nanoarchaeota archaeon]|nr:PepSY domain-containing protein [Nanoarchaeota archaeon]